VAPPSQIPTLLTSPHANQKSIEVNRHPLPPLYHLLHHTVFAAAVLFVPPPSRPLSFLPTFTKPPVLLQSNLVGTPPVFRNPGQFVRSNHEHAGNKLPDFSAGHSQPAGSLLKSTLFQIPEVKYPTFLWPLSSPSPTVHYHGPSSSSPPPPPPPPPPPSHLPFLLVVAFLKDQIQKLVSSSPRPPARDRGWGG
jgi:hypothetical protein